MQTQRCSECNNCLKLERFKPVCSDVTIVWNGLFTALPCERLGDDLVAGGADNPNVFPHYNGEVQSWALTLTGADEEEGFPRLRAVILAMKKYRPECLQSELHALLRSVMNYRMFGDRMFGSNAGKLLIAIERILSGNDESDRNILDDMAFIKRD